MVTENETHVHHGQGLVTSGIPLDQAERAVILLHGRGATAESIMELAPLLNLPGAAYLAPQAAYNRWYPQSFLAPLAANEPDLSSALRLVNELVLQIENAGIPTRQIWLAGFSQGACLASEFTVRQPRRYGGLLAFSGGIIGPPDKTRQDQGDLDGMPVFIGCSNIDPHIPVGRVQETADLLEEMNADVHLHIYPGMGHTITNLELQDVQEFLNAVGLT